MFRVGVITASDKGFSGQREDQSVRLIGELLESSGYRVEKYLVLPDEEDALAEEMIFMADILKVDLILTTGGTGFSKRDLTPEATIRVCDKMASGIAEAIRSYSLTITRRAMLSRAVSGIRGTTLIINLPGSPKAVREAMEYIMDSVHHGLEIMTGSATECASDSKTL